MLFRIHGSSSLFKASTIPADPIRTLQVPWHFYMATAHRRRYVMDVISFLLQNVSFSYFPASEM